MTYAEEGTRTPIRLRTRSKSSPYPREIAFSLGMQFNRARRPNVVPGNMGGCQFVILAERGLTAIVDGFDIPALG